MASAFSRSYAARGYLARRRRMVDGVALLVDAGGEAALGGDEQMFYTAGDASRSTRCVITSLGDGCLGLCCRLLSGASLVCICKKNTLAPRSTSKAHPESKPRGCT